MELLYLIFILIIQMIACRTLPDPNYFWLGTCILFGLGINGYIRRGKK